MRGGGGGRERERGGGGNKHCLLTFFSIPAFEFKGHPIFHICQCSNFKTYSLAENSKLWFILLAKVVG